jgi:hypothetical protein
VDSVPDPLLFFLVVPGIKPGPPDLQCFPKRLEIATGLLCLVRKVKAIYCLSFNYVFKSREPLISNSRNYLMTTSVLYGTPVLDGPAGEATEAEQF